MHNVRVGLIGYGFSASTFHAPLLGTISGFRITAVSSSKPELVKKDLPEAVVESEHSILIHRKDVDLIIITAPNEAHFPLAKEALEAGKHVVVEKPFVLTYAQGKELIDLARSKGVLLSVYHNRRWDNDFLTLREIIDSGRLGRVFTYEAHFDRYRREVRDRWRERGIPGSGLLYDLGAHLIDQALVLFGNPQYVIGDILSQREGAQADDYFHITLKYDRLRVILHSSMLVKEPGPHFLVHGDKGSFSKYGLDSQEETLKGGGRPGSPFYGEDSEENFGMLVWENKSGLTVRESVRTLPGRYQDYYKGIYSSIVSGAPSPVSAEEALNVIAVIECAQLSNNEHRTLPFPL
ncbi:oxidoreductase [Paenibacillus wynnii]|uniref:oxidoreductase n=1 Tax=Paenibacillus wynnii TaxID=268407 RepID=UPI00278D00D3|nr:oxidoreductase [Paenibacillus wynnii]MDQ0192109.1 scyllo-inositol 2-dehydrogenase (NADP+) [Paenibacillus wynnii]